MSRKVTSLTFDLFARDKTRPGFKSAESNGDRFANAMRRAGTAAAAGLAVAGAAAVAFGVQSVRAFADAEEAQNRLAFAFEKFPALADTSIRALQDLNSALMKKTRFDDDAIASGQAVLAQFGLTGSQLRRLTPLLLDYSTRTGKDLTEAAEDLGRALLGQGRALKVLGIEFTDTGSLAGNFDQLVNDLTGSVGGLAEAAATTAAGKLEMLQNRFGEVQETIGAALMPALESLVEWLEDDGMVAVEGFAGWLSDEGIPAVKGFADEIARMAEDGTLVPAVVGGLAAITLGMVGLNAAMYANPIGAVILLIAGLVAVVTAVVTQWDKFKLSAQNAGWAQVLLVSFTGIIGTIALFAQNWDNIWKFVQAVFITHVNNIIAGINLMLQPLQAVLNVINQLTGSRLSVRIDALALPRFGTPATSSQRPVNTSRLGGMPRLAEGGIVRPTPGGTSAVIGEAVIPLTARNLSMMGSGSGVNVTINGFVGTSKDQVAQAIVRVIEDAKRSGAVRSSALA